MGGHRGARSCLIRGVAPAPGCACRPVARHRPAPVWPPGPAFGKCVRAALREDDGLTTVVEWLREGGYEVSRKGLLAV